MMIWQGWRIWRMWSLRLRLRATVRLRWRRTFCQRRRLLIWAQILGFGMWRCMSIGITWSTLRLSLSRRQYMDCRRWTGTGSKGQGWLPIRDAIQPVRFLLFTLWWRKGLLMWGQLSLMPSRGHPGRAEVLRYPACSVKSMRVWSLMGWPVIVIRRRLRNSFPMWRENRW